MAKSLDGDERAFAAIVERHKHALHRVVHRIAGNEEDSLEILQEAFVSAHRALRRYDSAYPLRGWLITIALNKARDWRRREAVRRFIRSIVPVGAAAEVADHAVPSDVALSDQQELAEVQARITALPRKLQDVLILRTLEGLSQTETAKLLHISEKAVETRLYRARQRLLALDRGSSGYE